MYQIIYADPPWSYRDKSAAGKRGASFKYDTMSLADIIELPVQTISAPDCALFLWVTMPLLHEGLDVIQAWGFEYKTVAFTWVKLTSKSKVLHWGMGNWTRANAELCLLGIKGKPKRLNAGVHSVIQSPVRLHSQKPEEARTRIVKLLGDVPRVELFARDKAQGWHSWGNEIECDIEL